MQRQATGKGQHLDLSLFDCMSGVLANQSMNYLATGDAPSRMGNKHPNIAPYQTFPTSDGHLIVAVGNDQQFKRLCTALNIPSVAQDDRFQNNSGRVKHRDALEEILTAQTRQHARDDLLAILESAVVPAGPINTVADVFNDPQFKARQMQINPDGIPGVRTPLIFSDANLSVDRRCPKLGEHND